MSLSSIRGQVTATDFWFNLNLQGGIFASGVAGSLASGASFDLLMVTGEFPVLTRLGAAVTGTSDLIVFEDTVTSNDGTPATFANGNRVTKNTTSVSMFTAPTIDTEPADLGTPLASVLIPANTRVLTTDFTEGIFKASTKYLFRLTNTSPSPDELSLFIETSEMKPGFFPSAGI